jgi:S-formylglutathione hydrolase FrmB
MTVSAFQRAHLYGAIVAALLAQPWCGIARAAGPVISAAKRADNGFVVYDVRSEFQAGTTQIFTRAPAKIMGGPLLTLYVLPVEAHDEKRWGDARAEIAKLDLANRYRVVVVFPTFSHLPWFADHPSDPHIRQETYLLKVVLPFIERIYPVGTDRYARSLLGFSKSGWGAWTLLLRHPDLFGKAAAWDAPMTMDVPRYGMAPIVGTQDNFERYRVTTLLRARGALLGSEPRLMLTGWDFYREQTVGARRLLQQLKILHVYRDGPQRRHHWNSGWMPELARWSVR